MTETWDLAERVARSRYERVGLRGFTESWDSLSPDVHSVLTVDATEWLMDVERAGLAVVRGSEP